jgi:DNA-binding MarR family transcriptional regulator
VRRRPTAQSPNLESILNYRCPDTNGELADWMGVTPPTMSRMVDALVKRKFVKRMGSVEDRRLIHLLLTPRGQEKFNRISGEVRKSLTERVATLRPGEKQNLALGLDVLREMFK